MEVATSTADGRYLYDAIVVPSGRKPKRLIDLAGDMNSYLEKENGWNNYKQWPPVTRLGPGRWGTDINVSRIACALTHFTNDNSIDEIAKAVHEGWANCFNYWYIHKPWTWETQYGTKLYFPPGRSLPTRSKVERGKSRFDELDEYQKKMCRQMATFIKNECM